MKVKATILGSGTSSGVPYIGCSCPVCTSTNSKNKRLRSSCLFEVNGKNIIIDTTPDFRAQVLQCSLSRVDAVFYTHTHADHIHGIDDLRTFNFIQRESIPIYGNQETINEIVARFGYIFNPKAYSPGGKPSLVPQVFDGDFNFLGIPVQVIRLRHGRRDNVGYRIGSVAWLTDTNGVYPEDYPKLKGLDVLFVDGLRKTPHESHFCLDDALVEAQKIKAKQTVLIHLTHDYDHDIDNAALPPGVQLAYDNLSFECESQ